MWMAAFIKTGRWGGGEKGGKCKTAKAVFLWYVKRDVLCGSYVVSEDKFHSRIPQWLEQWQHYWNKCLAVPQVGLNNTWFVTQESKTKRNEPAWCHGAEWILVWPNFGHDSPWLSDLDQFIYSFNKLLYSKSSKITPHKQTKPHQPSKCLRGSLYKISKTVFIKFPKQYLTYKRWVENQYVSTVFSSLVINYHVMYVIHITINQQTIISILKILRHNQKEKVNPLRAVLFYFLQVKKEKKEGG